MKDIKKLIVLPIVLMTLGFTSVKSSSNTHTDKDQESVTTPTVRKVSPNTVKASSSDYCLLTFTPNTAGSTEGSFTDGEYIKKFEVRKGHNWNRIKNKGGIPTKDKLKTSVSGHDFKGWKNGDNKFIDDYYTFNDDTVTLGAKWGEGYVEDPTDFSSDTWDQFIQTANLGFDELKRKYAKAYNFDPDHPSFVIQNLSSKDEIAAKTRYVQIKGLNCPVTKDGRWPVRVVAENQDKIYNSFDEVAPLTFEFSYVINPAISWDYTGLQGHQSWENSTLKKYLNTYIYYQIEDVVQSGIQYVSKNTDNGYGVNEVEANKEILFLNSSAEIGSSKSDYENSTYRYYTDHPGDEYRKKKNPYNIVDGEPQLIDVWLRTPSIARGKNNCKAYFLNKDGGLGSSDPSHLNEPIDTKTAMGVAPCFAVGIEHRTGYQFSGTTALSLTPVEPYGTSANGFKAKINLVDETKYDLPTVAPKITYTNSKGESKELIEGEEEGKDFTYKDGIITVKNGKIEDLGKLTIITSPDESNKFKTDSWVTLIDNANKGIDKLKEEYGDALVGKVKYLTVDGIQYKTRVIGQAEDTLADGTGKAALTFQFETVIEFSDGSKTIAYDNNDATTFENSKLNKSLEAFMANMPEGIRKVNKTITHKEIEPSGDTSGFRSATLATKLFPLSFSELNLNNKVSHAVESEGNAYSYYKNEGSKYNPELYKFLDNKTYTEVPVWLRSPATNKNADYINIDSEIKQDKNATISSENYVAPAFCIGATKVEHNITFKGEDYTSNQEGFAKTMKAKSGDQFILKGIHTTDSLLPLDEESCYIRTTKNREFTDFKFKFDQITKTYTLSIMNMPDEDLDITFVSKGPLKLSVMNDCSSEAAINVFLTKSTQVTTSMIEFDYSIDGINFNEYKPGGETIVTINNKITSPATKKVSAYFRAKDVNKQISFPQESKAGYSSYFSFNSATNNPKVIVSGNVMSLFNKNCVESSFKADGGICNLFSGCTNIYDASSLLIGAKTVEGATSASQLYCGLFDGCSNLIDAPFKIEFNSEFNINGLFCNIFRNCTNLVKAPHFKTNGLHSSMFHRAFASNSNLEYAPNFEIGSIYFSSGYTFRYCFSSCTKLKKGPDYLGGYGLTLGPDNEFAFSGCTSLESTPEINFTSLGGDKDFGLFGRWFQVDNGKTSSLKYAKFTNISSINTDFKTFFYTFNNCMKLNTIVIDCLKDGIGNSWNNNTFFNWLNGCYQNTDEQYDPKKHHDGIHYIYLRDTMCNHLLAYIKKSGYSTSSIRQGWGIRNLDTGEEVLGLYAK